MKTEYGNPLVMGVTKRDDKYNFAVRSEGQELNIELYRLANVKSRGRRKPDLKIKLDSSYKTGNVFAVQLSDIDLSGYGYRYVADGAAFVDPYARTVTECERFGVMGDESVHLGRVELDEFDWESDKAPRIPYDESIIYKLHVRGFTKSRTSGVSAQARGTFAGITEKIPYLKELGITAIELMPAYEFDEIARFAPKSVNDADRNKSDHALQTVRRKLNYWGYAHGYYFAPKSAYSAMAAGNSYADYTIEFKQMVKELHKNGIEVIMELYFTSEDSYMIEDCLRYWVMEYHIDGVHLYCDECRLNVAADDPILSSTKIFTVYWNGRDNIRNAQNTPPAKHMANYNTGFAETARRLLKGDENQLAAFVQAMRANPPQSANINYITNHNGFTMMDLVSYDRKHNEANGEDNRDGENFNHSWNCGVEGVSRKKKVNELRLSQIRNAFMILLTSQGTPLILAGDEFGNSQAGNNNPYCIDNDTTWLDWKKTAAAQEITEFVKKVIRFRKEHGILHMPQELTATDSLSCGYPDISYHGDNAWYSRMESFERCLGIMYCGRYVQQPENEVLYIAYNLHWEPHKLALPNIADGEQWKIELATSSKDICIVSEDKRNVTVPPRSITILSGSIEARDSKGNKPVKSDKPAGNRKRKSKA